VALYLLKNRERVLKPLILSLQEAQHCIFPCSLCGFLDETDPCLFCKDEKRDQSLLCVVSDVADLWAIEKTRRYQGLYHVLGGNLSLTEGIAPKDLRMASLLKRLQGKEAPREVILALSPTVEGQTTAHYVRQEIQALGGSAEVSTLAQGIPLGGELDYLDEGTLSLAVVKRKHFEAS
jgi:recombination protein RecR